MAIGIKVVGSQQHEDGFSLVEILVALFIMALASAMIVMAMPAGRDPLEEEADRFSDVLTRTSDLAIARGQARGIRISDGGYAVYTRVAGRWVPSPGEQQALPSGMTINLVTKTQNKDDERPQIVADSSGIISGSAVRIARGPRSREIRVVQIEGASAR